jgi:hypothetical protein
VAGTELDLVVGVRFAFLSMRRAVTAHGVLTRQVAKVPQRALVAIGSKSHQEKFQEKAINGYVWPEQTQIRASTADADVAPHCGSGLSAAINRPAVQGG